MNMHKVHIFLVIFARLGLVLSEPITAALIGGGVVGGVLIAGSSKWVYCRLYECCNDKWTRHNASGIARALHEKLFGQHLVVNIVPKAMEAHLLDANPAKALVMSFHGWTGSGKNYVSDIITRHIYKQGTRSSYVHKKIATNDYAHPRKLETYKKELKDFIEAKTKACERSVFIFDEIDKMPEGLADVIKPYINHRAYINGVDFTKNIFIFLSNLAGEAINKLTYKHLRNGGKREDISAVTMEELVSQKAFNQKGGFKYSSLIRSGFIDHFVPFFPLERNHVKQCAAKEIRKRGRDVQPGILEKIASDLLYFPPEDQIFSNTGCKRVEKIVSLHL